MARIKPFKGIRPPKDLIEQVASRPYDVLNSEEAREEAKGNEKSLDVYKRQLLRGMDILQVFLTDTEK